MEYEEWFKEALPVLEYLRRERERDPYLTPDLMSLSEWAEVAEAVGISEGRVWLSLEALEADGLIDANIESAGMGEDQPPSVFNIRITPAGLRELKIWPPREASPEMFLEMLDSLLAAAPPEDKAKLRRFRAAAGSLGVDVLGSIIQGVTSYAMGRAIGG